jgi:hypothetical protein
MKRLALAIVVVTVGCSGRTLGARSDGGDGGGGVDIGAPACPDSPGQFSQCPAMQSPYDCSYPDRTCTCMMGYWYCRSPSCPKESAGGSCNMPGLECDYGFEQSCACVAPENVWQCCGGVGQCPVAIKEGALCCGAPIGPPVPSCRSACDAGGLQLACTCDGLHLHCLQQSCADGGA